MDNNVHLGDGVRDEVIADINDGLIMLAKMLKSDIVDYIGKKFKNAPETFEQIFKSPELKQNITTVLYSEWLSGESLASKDYDGLKANLIDSNLLQQGYLEGLYVGYILAMMALVDNDVPEDIILATRDYIRPKLLGNCYENRDEFVSQFRNDEKYSWISRAKNDPSANQDEISSL